MNIDANTASGPPAPAQKAGAGRNRPPGDAVTDPPGTASFMSLLHDLTAAAEGTVLSEDGGSTPFERGCEAGDGQAVPQSAAASPDGAAPLVHPAGVAAVPAQADAKGARAAGAGVAGSGGTPADDGLATVSAADSQEQQTWPAASDDAANTSARRPGVAAVDTGALARQQASEVALSAPGGNGRPDAEAEALAKDAMQASAARPLMTPQATANAVSVVSMFEAGLAGLRAGPGGRVQERGAARANHLPDLANSGFVFGADAGPGNSASQMASPVYAPTAAAPVPAAALAQKLHYWVAGGVQSAQLQLDAFDGGSVDVHIAVKGEEAYVEFRSDQPQARKLLIDAMPHLKDLLAGEGLMLSGGFVGDSAQHQSEASRAHRERFPGARSVRERDALGAAAPATAVRAALGSAVDLFV